MINLASTAVVQNIDTKNNTVVPFKPLSQNADTTTTVALQKTQSVSEDQRRSEEEKKAAENAEKNKKDRVSQAMLDGLSNDIEHLHSVSLSFSKNDATGQTVVKVINKDTSELIREIPSEQVLDMAAKLDEMVGLLFDAKV
jgi:flagellar protein FlaG